MASRISREYLEDVKAEIVRRLLLKLDDFVGAMVGPDGLVYGDVKLSKEEVIMRVAMNMQSGVLRTMARIAPTQARAQISEFNAALKAAGPKLASGPALVANQQNSGQAKAFLSEIAA